MDVHFLNFFHGNYYDALTKVIAVTILVQQPNEDLKMYKFKWKWISSKTRHTNLILYCNIERMCIDPFDILISYNNMSTFKQKLLKVL
jgi:hypothetical protein